MNLSAHFSLEELTRTDQRYINNTCPPELMGELINTAVMLEHVRTALVAAKGFDVPIHVTSGYRSLAVNTAVGSNKHSDHLKALAIDFVAPAFGTPYQIAKFLALHVDDLGIGQLIHEFGRWVHVSRGPVVNKVNRVITISGAGVLLGIQEVA